MNKAPASSLDLPEGIDWPDMGSDVADLICSRPGDVTTTAPQRPTDEQIVMVVADTYQVSEDVAYGWLAGFGCKSEAA